MNSYLFPYGSLGCLRRGIPGGNPALLENRCHTFLTRNARPAGPQAQEEKEDIEVLLKPLAAIPALIRSGQITHSLVVAAFYRLFMEFQP
jgi:hypothetical protein